MKDMYIEKILNETKDAFRALADMPIDGSISNEEAAKIRYTAKVKLDELKNVVRLRNYRRIMNYVTGRED